MKYLYGIVAFFVLMYASMPLWADKYEHHYYPAPDVTYVTEITEVYETYNVTETYNATDQQIADAVMNASTVSNYTPDECQGMAMAMATGNNTMYMGTPAPQLSLGIGECDNYLASSLQFGMAVNKKLMLTGSWGADEKTKKNAFGVGATVIFK